MSACALDAETGLCRKGVMESLSSADVVMGVSTFVQLAMMIPPQVRLGPDRSRFFYECPKSCISHCSLRKFVHLVCDPSL